MVFSSIPVYLDPPNWHQQQNLPLASDLQNPQLPPLPPSQPLTHGPGGSGGSGGGPGSIRPSSMADRARMAKMPQPETALKCPRCESANTKFCYFNNYSLSQPRHFCKTCRRYWTRGGALRNVPVGGGCRRNKKSKSSNSSSSSRSKSPVANTTTATTNQNADLMTHFLQPQSQLPTSFLASIQNLSRYGGGGNMGLNFSTHEMQQAQSDVHHDHHHMGFSGNMIDSLSAGGGGDHQGVDQWRNLQQIPFMGGFDQSITPSTGFLYAFNQTGSEQGGMVNGECSSSSQLQLRTNMPSTTSSRVSPVKMEDNGHRRSLTRPNLGISENNNTNQLIWGTGISAWTDLSGTLNSSSTTHLL